LARDTAFPAICGSAQCPGGAGSGKQFYFGGVVAGKQLKRFVRWRTRLPENTATLVSLIIDEVVPIFELQEFQRFADYAGDSGYAVGAATIALQRRSGPEWPTVEIHFGSRGDPYLGLSFAMLPETCFRFGPTENAELPRREANVAEGAMFFSLCKGERKNYDCNFGCASIFTQMLCNQKKIRSEIDKLKALLPWLFNVLNHGIPPDWPVVNGRAHTHAFAQKGAVLMAQAAREKGILSSSN
jgi:hypothetical protein